MEAKGDVISNFIESATVKAGGAVYTDAIMHSKIEANSDIIVSGKRGLIAGGSVATTTRIEDKNCRLYNGDTDRIRGWSGHNFR